MLGVCVCVCVTGQAGASEMCVQARTRTRGINLGAQGAFEGLYACGVTRSDWCWDSITMVTEVNLDQKGSGRCKGMVGGSGSHLGVPGERLGQGS